MKQMGKFKNNLDERQEQALLEVEHIGCWMAFWGLLIALAVQFVMGKDFSCIAGEWVVFMILSIYLAGACLKRGIWDRHFKPDAKTNMLFSVVSAAAFGGIMFVYVYRRFPEKIIGSIASGVFAAGFMFVLVFVTLSVSAQIFKKRQKDLETEPEENEEKND